MSVIIKGMAMPETCYECRFREEYSNGDLCVAHLNKITDFKKRLETCPLEEVQEPKHGRFVGTEYDGYADGYPVYYEWECSECGFIFEEDEPRYNYCPNCGAIMDGDDYEEPGINPCRGCDDYDGRGGCKSHGACGEERSEG